LYDALHQRAPSPVVALNRAVAVGQAEGADAALPLVEALVADAALARYHLLHAVHGDLLHKAGRRDAARAAFERAAELAGNERERELMQRRAAELSQVSRHGSGFAGPSADGPKGHGVAPSGPRG
jgi:predicted RNA polymerase sigma factor